MRLSLQTWNSVSINNGSPFYAFILPGQLANYQRNIVLVDRANEYPALSSVVKTGSVIVIQIVIGPGQNINTQREALKGYFFGDDQRHDLVAYDLNDSSKAYYRTGIPSRLVQESDNTPNSFFVTIATEYPYWQQVTPTSDSWDITASGDSDTVTNSGNLPIAPVFTITPTTTKAAGLKYRRYVPIYNNLDRAISLPLEITGGGLDVQSLIDANKMQADGDDFRIWKNGAFTDRWLSGMDSDSDPAKCWVNIGLAARKEGSTGATFDSDDTTLVLSQTRANLSFLQSLKTVTNPTLLIESEAVSFDAANIDTINYQITSVTRGQKGTTAVSHAAASTARHIEHDLFILYGDSDLTAPDTDDTNKPIFDLTSSNAAWSYTNYYDTTAPNRPGAWKGETGASRTKLSYPFTGDENTFANPSTRLGLAEVNSVDFTVPHETATLTWLFNHPAGLADATYSGDKYSTASWPGVAGLQYLVPNTVWVTAENQAAPAIAYTWEEFGPSTVTFSGAPENIRFCVEGVLSSTYSEMALVQFHTVSVSFDSDSLPTISVGVEESINFFDIKLTNSTTGEYIKVQCPCPVNTALTIDCAAKVAYLADGRKVPVVLSSDRNDWLNLRAGANTLVYEDAGTVAVTVVISHKDKNL